MITTGSKYFFGLAAFAFVAAVVYGVATAGHQIDMDSLVGVISLGYKGSTGDNYGFTVLMTLCGASLLLGVTSSAFRDADPEAAAELLALDAVPATAPPQGASYWPILGAFGIACVLVGMVVGSPLVVLGAAALAIATFEWAGRAWSERATGDPAVNQAIRHRVLSPIEIPLLGFVGVALFVVSISRILLALPTLGAYAIFGGAAAIILLVGWFITVRPSVNRNVVTAILLILGVAVLVGGVIAAEAGPHKESHHEGSVTVVHQNGPTTSPSAHGGQHA